MLSPRRLLRPLFLLFALLGVVPVAHAATFTVTKVADTNDGSCNSDCSLREAVAGANADGEDSAIVFDATAFSTLKTILLSGGELGLGNNGTLSIAGPAAGVDISGNSVSRVISVGAGANVTLTGLGIKNGKSAKGAGISNSGTLTVNTCTIASNVSSDFGGGVYNLGTLTLTQSSISGNTATTQQGGAIHNGNDLGNVAAVLTMSGCLVWNNRSVFGGGLSMQYASTATATNCTFYGNVADNRGAGVYNGGDIGLTNCTFVVNGNLGISSGGGVYGHPTASGSTSLINCLGTQNTPDTFAGSWNDNGGNVQAASLQQAGLNATGLANNGGPTQTIALVTKGTAVNAGVDIADDVIFDQRGSFFYRKVGGRVDSGAYESSFAIVLVSNEGLSLRVGATATITQDMLQTTDVNNDTLTYTITSATTHGTVKLNGNPTSSFTQADIAAGNVSYTQDGSFFGSDFFVFSVTDGKGGIVNGGFAITITQDPSLVVTITADTVATDGQNSLREAIAYANSNPDPSTITFNIPDAQKTGGVWIINTGSALSTTEITTIIGPGVNLLTVRGNDANKSYAVIEVWKGLTLSGATLSNDGAGLANKSGAISSLSNCAFTDNAYGLDNLGTLTVSNCTINGNATAGWLNNNGAIATLTNCTLSNNGYGLLNFGTATVTNCTLSGSTNDGIQGQGISTVTNCTISGSGGAGFLNISSTPTTLTNCTLSGNNIGVQGSSGSTTLTNCTITGSTNTGFLNFNPATLNNCLIVGNTTNLGGGTVPGGSNNITTGTVAAAGLDPIGLKNNGGPTQTIALMPGSPAIDAANGATAPATDQRGTPRPQGAQSDIGAYERQSVTVSISDRTVTEGSTGTTNATFTVTLSAASTQTVTVQYATANGTAQSTAPTDYGARTGTLTFAPGQTSKTITVPVVGDTRDEVNETFFVNLSGAVNASIADAQGQCTITDDDAAPTISINDKTVTEGSAGNTNAVFTVTLSAVSGRTVTVNYATANGTAQSGAPTDYGARTGTLTFSPGQTSKSISVPVVGDTLDEVDETFVINLSGVLNATIADGQGQCTITDDDAPPSLSIGDKTVTEGSAGNTNVVFTVTLSAASGKAVTVNYATANGTAQSGAPTDYGARTGKLTFAPEQTSKSITVPVVGDTLDEVDETFVVNLSGAVNASVADAQGQCTITDDDAPPSLSIGDKTVTEGSAGNTNVVFTVTLSAASGKTVTVNYATANGTAQSAAPTDYGARIGTLSFAPGQTSKTITVPVVGDTNVEVNETFFVNLSAATNATIADGQGLGTITNDEVAPLQAPFEDEPSE